MFMVFHYDACSDHNITSRMCGHVGGHAYSVSVLKWLLDWRIRYPIANLRHISRVHIRGWECSIQQNMLASWRLNSHSHFFSFGEPKPTVSSTLN